MKKMFGMKAALVLALVGGVYLPLAVTEATAARIRQ